MGRIISFSFYNFKSSFYEFPTLVLTKEPRPYMIAMVLKKCMVAHWITFFKKRLTSGLLNGITWTDGVYPWSRYDLQCTHIQGLLWKRKGGYQPMSDSPDDKAKSGSLSVHPGGAVDARATESQNAALNRPAELPLTRDSKRALISSKRAPSSPQPPVPVKATIWTESMLNALEPHEHDFQEFKGSGWIMRAPNEIQPDFMFYLSKQVSAFVNGSGGLLFIGLNDNGLIDGGVPIDLKGEVPAHGLKTSSQPV